MEFTETLSVFENAKLLYPHVKLGILGGTFNPVHNGHIDMALNIMREFYLKAVLLMPSGNPPHKQGDNQSLAPAQQRLHMVALAACGVSGLEVSDLETKRSGFTYTIDTMRELTSKYKEVDFHFIIGSDSLFELELWKSFAELSRLVRFVCVRRQEHDALSVAAEAARLHEAYGTVVLVSEYIGLHVSSSYIRKRIAEGKSISDFVPALVEEYIIASRLYKRT